MTNYYTEFSPTFEDRFDWASPTVLRHHAEVRTGTALDRLPLSGFGGA